MHPQQSPLANCPTPRPAPRPSSQGYLIASLVAIASLTTSLSPGLSPPAQAASLLGPAADYNAFFLGDLTQVGGDLWGKLAVGGNANLTNVGVGDRLPNTNGSADHLVVGGDLTVSGGQVFGGNAVVGGSVNGIVNFNCAPQCQTKTGQTKTGTPIDFGAAASFYHSLSAQLATLAPAGSTTLTPWGHLHLTGTAFNTSLSGVREASLSTPSGTELVVITVNDSTVNLPYFGNLLHNGNSNATNWSKVIWNFTQATELDFSNLSWKGTILAPKANLILGNGNIEGQVIAKSGTLTQGSGEFHDYQFTGRLPDPTPVPEAGLGLGIMIVAGALVKGRVPKTSPHSS